MHIMCFGFATLFHKWQKKTENRKIPKNRKDLGNELAGQKDLDNELQCVAGEMT